MRNLIKIGMWLIAVTLSSFAHAAEPGVADTPRDSLTFSLFFRLDDDLLLRNYRSNEQTLNRIDQLLNTITAQQMKHICIIGSASPDGNELRNRELAQRRACAIGAYIRWKHPQVDLSCIQTSFVSDFVPAWLQVVEQDFNVPRRDKVLEILQSEASVATKWANIQLLVGGPAEYMEKQLFPPMRNAVSCVIVFNKAADATRELSPEAPTAAATGSKPQGLYCDATATGSKLQGLYCDATATGSKSQGLCCDVAGTVRIAEIEPQASAGQAAQTAATAATAVKTATSGAATATQAGTTSTAKAATTTSATATAATAETATATQAAATAVNTATSGAATATQAGTTSTAKAATTASATTASATSTATATATAATAKAATTTSATSTAATAETATATQAGATATSTAATASETAKAATTASATATSTAATASETAKAATTATQAGATATSTAATASETATSTPASTASTSTPTSTTSTSTPTSTTTQAATAKTATAKATPTPAPRAKSAASRAEKPLMALKTNLLFDALTILNIGVEVPIGPRWSVAGEWMFPWWIAHNKQHALQVMSGTVEGKYWFGNRQRQPDGRPRQQLTGWFAGIYAGGGYYDLEWNHTGYQGEFFIAAGVSGGYAHTINKQGNLRMEYSLGIGYMQTDYRKYEAQFGADNKWHLYRRANGKYQWFGPTSLKVSLVWMLNHKQKGGSK